ncbi:MAG: hypothetical protein RL097_152 [Candidatus Parcubacteria bacterium]|jgi:hypothetical protein
MKLSQHIIDEAKRLLAEHAALPAHLSSAPAFYVAADDDKSILTFSVVKHGGKTYKIGARNG